MGFTPGQRFCTAIQGQVIEPDINQKAVAGAQFLEDLVGNFTGPALQFQRLKIVEGFTNSEMGDFRERALIDKNIAGVGAKTGALAGLAGCGRYIF